MAEASDKQRAERQLSPATLDALLDFLGPDRERASEQYQALHHRLCRLFEWRGARYPEDLADEVMNRMARRLEGGLEVLDADPYKYLSGIAYRLLHEEYRSAERSARDTRDAGVVADLKRVPEQERLEREVRISCLEECLSALDENSRHLILEYYKSSGVKLYNRRKELAESLGLTPQALRLRTHRIRLGLETCVSRCVEKKATRGLMDGLRPPGTPHDL